MDRDTASGNNCFECQIDCKDDGVHTTFEGKDVVFCKLHYELRICPVCQACKSIVKHPDNELITLFTRNFHKNCVRCVSCNVLIEGEDNAVPYLNGFLCKKCPIPKGVWQLWPAPPGGH